MARYRVTSEDGTVDRTVEAASEEEALVEVHTWLARETGYPLIRLTAEPVD